MVQWIMECVSSPSYSVLINGEVEGFFKGSRGLRQGDPISPFLFVLVMEMFTRKLQRAAGSWGSFIIRGVSNWISPLFVLPTTCSFFVSPCLPKSVSLTRWSTNLQQNPAWMWTVASLNYLCAESAVFRNRPAQPSWISSLEIYRWSTWGRPSIRNG